MSKKLIFTYPGSKGLLSKWILPQLPTVCNRYIEIFAGRANLYFNYVLSGRSAKEYYLNDINTGEWLKQLRDYKTNYDFLPDSPNFEIFKKWKDSPDSPERTIVESAISFMGGNYSIGGSRYDKNPHYKNSWKEKFILGNKLLQNVNISKLDYRVMIDNIELSSNDFIYLDPPYDNGFSYKYNEPQAYENINHDEFLYICNKLSKKCMIAISGFKTERYAKELSNWNESSKIRYAAGKNKSKQGKFFLEEYLWKNF